MFDTKCCVVRRLQMNGKMVLIDGHSILNRAFFGLPPLTNSEGLHTNAIYGFLNIMFKIIAEELIEIYKRLDKKAEA